MPSVSTTPSPAAPRSAFWRLGLFLVLIYTSLLWAPLIWALIHGFSLGIMPDGIRSYRISMSDFDAVAFWGCQLADWIVSALVFTMAAVVLAFRDGERGRSPVPWALCAATVQIPLALFITACLLHTYSRGLLPGFPGKRLSLALVLTLFPLGVLAARGAWWSSFSSRRARRILQGLCVACGYDLRGSPGPACPECGQPIQAKDPPRPPCPSFASLFWLLGISMVPLYVLAVFWFVVIWAMAQESNTFSLGIGNIRYFPLVTFAGLKGAVFLWNYVHLPWLALLVLMAVVAVVLAYAGRHQPLSIPWSVAYVRLQVPLAIGAIALVLCLHFYDDLRLLDQLGCTPAPGTIPLGLGSGVNLGREALAAVCLIALAALAPLWLPAVRAVWQAIFGRRARRLRLGLCVACGYDLRGSPGPACPECGHALPAGAKPHGIPAP